MQQYNNRAVWEKAINMGLLRKKENNEPYALKWVDSVLEKVKKGEEIYKMWRDAYHKAEAEMSGYQQESTPSPSAPSHSPVPVQVGQKITSLFCELSSNGHYICKLTINGRSSFSGIYVPNGDPTVSPEDCYEMAIDAALLNAEKYLDQSFESMLEKVHKKDGDKFLTDSQKAHICMTLEVIFNKNREAAKIWRSMFIQKKYGASCVKDGHGTLTLCRRWQYKEILEAIDQITQQEIEMASAYASQQKSVPKSPPALPSSVTELGIKEDEIPF